jgi:hypothetical protein
MTATLDGAADVLHARARQRRDDLPALRDLDKIAL